MRTPCTAIKVESFLIKLVFFYTLKINYLKAYLPHNYTIFKFIAVNLAVKAILSYKTLLSWKIALKLHNLTLKL